MMFEESISISASPDKVFSVYSAVADWPAWDSEVESARLNGDFHLGTEGKIKPKGAPESTIKIVELTPNQSFTIECKLPLCRMWFIHLIQATTTGSHVINKVEFNGLLAPLFGRLIGKSIHKTMPSSLAGLKRFVEINEQKQT